MMLCLHIFCCGLIIGFLLLRKVILWECNVAICAIILFFVDWYRISLGERPTFFTRVKESRQKNTPQLNRSSLLCFNFLNGNLLNSLRSNRRKLPEN